MTFASQERAGDYQASLLFSPISFLLSARPLVLSDAGYDPYAASGADGRPRPGKAAAGELVDSPSRTIDELTPGHPKIWMEYPNVPVLKIPIGEPAKIFETTLALTWSLNPDSRRFPN
jgi:hypothetical protein